MELKLNIDEALNGTIRELVEEKIKSEEVILTTDRIQSSIDIHIHNQVSERLSSELRMYFDRYYDATDGNIQGKAKKDLEDIVKSKFIEKVQEEVDKFIENLPQETLDKIVLEMFTNTLSQYMLSSIISQMGRYNEINQTMMYETAASVMRQHGFNI